MTESMGDRPNPNRVSDIEFILPRNTAWGGIDDYCYRLADALQKRSLSVGVRVLDPTHDAVAQIRSAYSRELPDLVVFPYTDYLWNPNFGVGISSIRCVRAVADLGARVALHVHDPIPPPGGRVRDKARRLIRSVVLRHLLYEASVSFWTLESAADSASAAFLPAGSSLNYGLAQPLLETKLARVAVFGVTPGRAVCEAQALAGIWRLVRSRTANAPQLCFVGVASDARAILEAELRPELGGLLEVHGRSPAEQIQLLLRSCQAALFVRGGVSSRRSSAIAALGEGLPLVAQRNHETSSAWCRNGILLAPEGDLAALAGHLSTLGAPGELSRCSTASAQLFNEVFHWDRISERFSMAVRE